MSDKLKSRYLRCDRYGRTEIHLPSGEHPWFEVVTVAASARSAGKDL